MNLPYTPEQLAALQSGGYLSPELAAQIAAQGGGSAGDGGFTPTAPTTSDGNASPDDLLRSVAADSGATAPPAQPGFTPHVGLIGNGVDVAHRGVGQAVASTLGLPPAPEQVPEMVAAARAAEAAKPAIRAEEAKHSMPPEVGAPIAPIGPSASALGGGGPSPLNFAPPSGGPSAASQQAMRSLMGASAASSDKVLDANASYQNALQQAGIAQHETTGAAQAAIRDTGDANAAILDQQQAFMDLSAKNQAATQAEIHAKLAEIKSVDPDRLWNSKSTGEKMLSGIAVALGAFGAGMPHSSLGGRNYALEILNAAKEDDIKAQLANNKQIAEGAQKTHDLAKDSWEHAARQQDLYDKARLVSNEKLKLQLQSYQAGTDDAQKQAGFADLIAKTEADSDKVRQARLASQMAVQQKLAAGVGGGLTREQLEKRYAKIMDAALEKGETPVDKEAFFRQALGQSGATTRGNAAPDPLAGVPEKDRGAAREELEKDAKYKQTIAQGRELAARALDPNASVLERARARDEWNAFTRNAHEQLGAPGRSAEQIDKAIAPVQLSAAPWTNDHERVGGFERLLPRPATPILSRVAPPPALTPQSLGAVRR